ncbi:carbohydrate deacetylase [Vibrio makurazakiensis]|uniref:carbohydrate deacetylase n=1 Tax=Vibrio makurazakiensis TaxID=2910250 RepID=UPI003D0FD94A
MKLIINADDLGLTESVNNGIVECMRAGIVTSTTVMMNQDGAAHAAKLFQHGLIPEVGLHFTVTCGKPMSKLEDVPSLVDGHGNFYDKAVLMTKSDVCEEEVYRELAEQYQAAIHAGFDITHLDSHHFAGAFSPLKQAFIRFANDINLPARRVDNIVHGQDNLKVPTPDAFDMSFFDNGVSIEQLKALILSYQLKIPNGTLELMSHPSSNENIEHLRQLSSYADKRVLETAILTSPELKRWLDEQQIECVGFQSLNS